MKRASRFPPLRKGHDGKYLCRGCGGTVPKGRRTWCSAACASKHNPYNIKLSVWERDKGFCQMCLADLRNTKTRRPYQQYRNGEYDHIIPFSEGGLTVVENMRLLCGPCHKKRTAEWRKQKARKVVAQPEFLEVIK